MENKLLTKLFKQWKTNLYRLITSENYRFSLKLNADQEFYKLINLKHLKTYFYKSLHNHLLKVHM